MYRYGLPDTSLTIALHGGLYLAILVDRCRGPGTALTIALHGGLYLAIIIYLYGGPEIAFTYSLAWRHLTNHYNGQLWRGRKCPYI
jgi:hypothetical protein